ncbi:cupin domain-containing protein [Sphingomonas piscis]|uniref:Cupin domain-containing protein n=1 Tax=Sphingomonas piscis TaxID=2714943 RepID=A0A6G7YQI9_9SPHN|nr:cupin domain-containing protein [Sphingomonas piscis]QIK79002.1 cupin domain-containing protein [Sphingomonas piscis]
MTARSLERFPLHLGLGGTAVPQPEMGGPEWYEAYGDRTAGDGRDGRLVSLFSFSESWSSWEMHPSGDEVVMCLSGSMTLHQQRADGSPTTTVLNQGEYAINPPGVWHTADADGPVTALFITPGEGTTHKAREGNGAAGED